MQPTILKSGLAFLMAITAVTGCGKAQRQEARAANPDPPVAAAAAGPQAELFTDVRAIRPGESFTACVRIRLDPGWHTYWKNPGDVGAPIAVQWTIPKGCVAEDLEWPVPTRLVEDEFVTLGYEHEATLLAPMRTTDELAGAPELRLEAVVTWLICKDVCLPRETTIAAVIPVRDQGEAADATTLEVIAAARRHVPQSATNWTFQADASDTEIHLRITPPAGTRPGTPDFFPEQRGLVDLVQAPTWLAKEDGGTLLTLKRQPGEALAESLRGVLVVKATEPAMMIQVETGWIVP